MNNEEYIPGKIGPSRYDEGVEVFNTMSDIKEVPSPKDIKHNLITITKNKRKKLVPMQNKGFAKHV